MALLLAGCSAARPVAPVLTPASIHDYLRHHPDAPLRIADSIGRRRWIYNAELRGDTLRGFRNTTMPRGPIAIPISQLTEVAAHRFSATHTLGLMGGLAALVGVLALMAPKPVY